MICPTCKELNKQEIEMQLEESIHDFQDPSRVDGHGQTITKYWLCPVCKTEEDLIVTGEDYGADDDSDDAGAEGSDDERLRGDSGNAGEVA
jgi:hypothetical protein